ncbi:MAG: tetratricopeptide repeat protein [Dehalococcoidia bacterium]|nr:tetratricopeptide repeat protein [Dehalococcoidia bacterium]
MTDDRNAVAREGLQRAMNLHARGDIDEALALAHQAIEADPAFGEAWAYIGNTLVTRKRRFAEGLEALRRAVALSPDDVAVRYTSGWCQEFVANALARPKRPHQPVEQSAEQLYAAAKQTMLKALELDPDDQMRGDIEDILDVIANATGEPWDLGEYERAAPRPR